MEHNSSEVVISGTVVAAVNNNKIVHDHDAVPKKKKKRGPMHLIRVALYILKSNKTKKANAASTWQNLFGLGSMSPLHMQKDIQSPPRFIEGTTVVMPTPAAVSTMSVVEHLEVFTPPMSPAQASVASSSSYGMSQYASATNLQELDEGNESDEDYEEVGIHDDQYGDEMIDLKAEQFISQFYQQMRFQNEAYANRRNRQMNGGR